MQVPEGWSIGHVKDLLAGLNSGVSVNSEDISANKSEVGVLKVSAVSYGVFLPKENKRVIQAELNLVKESPRKGSILISRSNTEALVGASVYIHKDYPNLFLPDKLWQAITRKGKNLEQKWLFYFLSSEPTRYRLSKLATGTSGSMKNITKDELLTLPIKIPPYIEQQKIAQILSTWDKAIEKLEVLIAAKQKRKKALMQQLLTGKKRFAGFEGEWNEYKLEQICQFKKGKGLSKDKLNSDGKYKCILYGELYTKYGDVIGNVVSRTDDNDSVKSVLGDILIPSSTTTSGIDLANAVALLEDDVFLGGDINILRPNLKKVCSEFLAYLLTHIKKHQIASRAQGITIIHLYGSDLKPLLVMLPDTKEQQRIASVFSGADKEIETHQKQLSTLKQQKKGLMQQLLTGKKRVNIGEAA